MDALRKRLGKFGLELAEEKTRLVRFSKYDDGNNGSFEFLGFAFHWEKSRSGYPVVKRRTSPSRLRQSLRKLTKWLKENRHGPLRVLMKRLNAKLRGYWNYYGVVGNYRSLAKFFYLAKRLLFKWLNRRSQRRSYRWSGFTRMCANLGLASPRITEPVKQPTLFP